MARSASSRRIHRLPHHRDYSLIPAPLDLSLPLATEKSPLPAIIITPASPTSTRDFSIAFLAPPAQPSLRERLTNFKPLSNHQTYKLRSIFVVFLILFILVCHVVAHRLAARRPVLEFVVQGGDAGLVQGPVSNWFNFDIRAILGYVTAKESSGGGNFIITEDSNS